MLWNAGLGSAATRPAAARDRPPGGPAAPTCLWPEGRAGPEVLYQRSLSTSPPLPRLSVSQKGSVWFCNLWGVLHGALELEPLPRLSRGRSVLESLCPRECFVSVSCLSGTLLMFAGWFWFWRDVWTQLSICPSAPGRPRQRSRTRPRPSGVVPGDLSPFFLS